MAFTRIEFFKLIDGKLPSFADVGSYPLFYVDGNNNAICPDCATEYLEDPDIRYRPTGGDVNWEGLLYCEQCSQQIKAAYGGVDPSDGDTD
jgi:hypothetical protein